jgi:hypothetical protein
MDVKLIRMSSGEDVVAELLEQKENAIVVQNAIVAIPAGNSQLGFAPWAPILNRTKKELEVNSKFIVFIAEPDDSVVEQYEQMFSPISKPASKKLIL